MNLRKIFVTTGLMALSALSVSAAAQSAAATPAPAATPPAATSASVSAAEPPVLEPEALFERIAPSIWKIETFDARNQPLAGGSAVVTGPGQLVTNCHVLAQSRRVLVTRENVSYGATLEHPDPERDLCQLKVANFNAPAVTLAPMDGLKVGSRVYAIGNPRGLEQTLSDGLLSGLRKSASGELQAVQVSVPISRGSSGGGLFDARGRLIGITTASLRDSQNLNFAVPAGWIKELPERAKAALVVAGTAGAKPAGAAGEPTPAASASAEANVYEYRLRSRSNRLVRPVIYRLDRVEGERRIFNQGTRVESPDGQVLSLTASLGGEFDDGMPPGGWIKGDPQPGGSWKLSYNTNVNGRVRMDLQVRGMGESTFRFKDRELRVLRFEFKGTTHRNDPSNNSSGAYTSNVWWAPELRRVVRFDARSRSGVGGGTVFIDEVLELVDIRSE